MAKRDKSLGFVFISDRKDYAFRTTETASTSNERKTPRSVFANAIDLYDNSDYSIDSIIEVTIEELKKFLKK